MTITELKETFIQMGLHAEINYYDEVVCVYKNETARVDDWFIEIPFDALLFFHVDTNVEAALAIDGEALAKVEAVIALFLATPEEDRGIYAATHAENKYTIPMPGLQTSDGGQQFLSEKDGNYFSCKRTEDLHQVFTEDELYTEVPVVYREFAKPVEGKVKETDTDADTPVVSADDYLGLAMAAFSHALEGTVNE